MKNLIYFCYTALMTALGVMGDGSDAGMGWDREVLSLGEGMICDFTEEFHGAVSSCQTVQRVREGRTFKMFSSFYGMVPILC
jgi:hypothetical protein